MLNFFFQTGRAGYNRVPETLVHLVPRNHVLNSLPQPPKLQTGTEMSGVLISRCVCRQMFLHLDGIRDVPWFVLIWKYY